MPCKLFLLFVLCFMINGCAQISYHDGALLYGENVVANQDQLTSGQLDSLGLSYVIVDENQAAALGLRPAILLFNQQGKLVRKIDELPDFNFDVCGAIVAAPDGRTLALDQGTWVVRSWSFVSYPTLKEIAPPIAYLSDSEMGPDIIWLDSARVLVTSIDEDNGKIRTCDYEPCGVRSVVMYDLAAGKSMPLLPGGAMCDYTLKDYDGHSLIATKVCAGRLEQWRLYDSVQKLPHIEVTIPLE